MKTHRFAVYLVIQIIRRLRKPPYAVAILHRNFQSSEQITAVHMFLSMGKKCKYQWIQANLLLKCAYMGDCDYLDGLYLEECETISPLHNDVS